MPLSKGARLGSYEIVATLGFGGMGEVYRARDAKLRRDVAIKILPAALASDPDRLLRFQREALALAALSHPNILAIHDFATDGGITYAVMELVEGRTLRELLKSSAVPDRKAVSYAVQIAKGLNAAHTRGIVHRDLKPENLVITDDGYLKILDFGLAVQRAPASAVNESTAMTAMTNVETESGAPMGTPGYMSPEQVRGDVVDHRSDIFSFGCVMYEMLSGRRPFPGESPIDVLHATLRSEPAHLSTLSATSSALSRIITRCLEKAPSGRFQSALDLAFALEFIGEQRDTPVVTQEKLPAPGGIAVMPFENLGASEHSYFAAGVTEEVTLQLANISALRVMSRSAVARFKHGAADLPLMTRELRIGAILTGSVRYAGDQVRIGVQLLAAPSGETLWSQQYNGSMRDIFGVQTDVAVRVARALQASLAPNERARIARPPTENAQAYELFLKAGSLSVVIPKQNSEAIDLLNKAVALDPQFALGYAALARRYYFLGSFTKRDNITRGVEAARTAIMIDPQLARAHYALALCLGSLGQFEEARLEMQRSIELDSNSWNALEDLSLMEANAGRLDQAIYWSKRAFPLAPNQPTSYYHVAIPLVSLNDVFAERWLRAGTLLAPTDDSSGTIRLQIMLAIIEFRRGQADAAIARMRTVVAAQPENVEGRVVLTEIALLTNAPDACDLVDKAMADAPGARSWYTPYTPRTMRAFLWIQSGHPELADPLIDAAITANNTAMEAGDDSYSPPYENIALHLIRHDRAAALDWLERAKQAGFMDTELLKHDRLIAPLLAEPRFARVIDGIDRELQAMRRRVDLGKLDEWMTSVDLAL